MPHLPAAACVVVACGLAAEAKRADASSDAGSLCIVGDSKGQALEESLERHAKPGTAFVSFGIAGGLAPGLRPGTLLIATSVRSRESIWPTDPAWRDALRPQLPQARFGDFAGSDTIVATRADKALLHTRLGALCVDMESHRVAAIAARHGLPFIAIRSIADTASDSLPPLAALPLVAGRVNLLAILGSLGRQPWQVGRLPALARHTQLALNALSGCRRRLGPRMGLPDLDHLLIDLP